jgi:hypothetical protein
MLLAALRPAPAHAAVGPAAEPPYSVSTFAVSENGYTAADSITFSRTSVFIGYGNGGNPDGSGGAMSTIVKYKMDGTVVKTYTVVGHNDGLRYNTETGDLWALQNEDASATLIIIDPAIGKQRASRSEPDRTAAVTTISCSSAMRNTSAPPILPLRLRPVWSSSS